MPPGAAGEPAARQWFMAAVTHLQAGRHAAAEDAFRRVLHLLPHHANSLRNLGLLVRARGRPIDGLRLLTRALTLDPALARAPDLPLATLFAQDLARAEADGDAMGAGRIAAAWARWCPTDPRGHGALVMRRLADGDTTAAEAASRAAPPDARDPTLCHARALLALRAGRAAEATRQTTLALALAPAYADALTTLGLIAQRHRDGAGAETAFARALQLRPDLPAARLGLARLRLSEGEADAAAALMLAVPPAIRHAPAHVGDLLSVLHHAPGLTPEAVRTERDAWAPATGAWRPPHPAEAAALPQAPRHLVYLGDLTRPQVAALALPAMLAHAAVAAARHARVSVLHTTPPDQPAPPLPPDLPVDHVRGVPARTAPALRAALAALAPDVLILVTPTTLPQALEALAERQAPVQALWGDVFASIGLTGLDAVFTDRFHVPDRAARDGLAESPVCLPHGAYLFAPPDAAPPPGPPPCLRDPHGAVTFGSFNRLDKLHDPLLARWGRILAALPSARLLIQARALDRPGLRDVLVRRLTRQGLPPNRVRLEGGRDRAGMMDLYTRVDIALDSDPWSGGLTVLESLWMGVPVVALAGAPLCGRHAVSHLTRAGLADWITTTPDAYVARAIAAARDTATLTDIRATLRGRVAALPCLDPESFARQLDDACTGLWADHRAGRPPGSGAWAWPGPDPS
ncbi:tetratricopeptide repeat protein [Roseospira visakhapatnamensis]|uniref:protein O-GlcNAc transferase n=1 Tax=Roseospira visakhapatnamensis TaxID=390880 RepID=A0A7W6RDT7_9PROT|nr:Tfp pilus assembly protein PilF/glycosyltransferase involved in cell wall biosynthesis [Roseospira visakhapatnamensis]